MESSSSKEEVVSLPEPKRAVKEDVVSLPEPKKATKENIISPPEPKRATKENVISPPEPKRAAKQEGVSLPKPRRAQRRNKWATQVVFRSFAMIATFAAALVIIFDEQTTDVAGFAMHANYKSSPTFRFFMIGNFVATGYEMLALIVVSYTGTHCLVNFMDLVTRGFLVLIFQTFTLLSRISLSPQFPAFSLPVGKKGSSPREGITKPVRVGKLSLLSDSRNSSTRTTILKVEEAAEISNMGGETNNGFSINEMDRESKKDYIPDEDDDDIDLDGEEDPDSEFSFDLGNGMILKKVRDPVGGFIKLERIVGPKYVASPKKIGEPANGFELVSDGISKYDRTFESKEIKTPDNGSTSSPTASGRLSTSVNGGVQEVIETSSSKHVTTEASSISSSEDQTTGILPLSGLQATETLLENDPSVLLQSGPSISIKNSRGNSTSTPKRRKKQVMPPISEMNRLLLRNHASYRSMRPRWSSARDQQLLAAKAQIKNAPIVNKDHELYAPAFRNISMFKRYVVHNVTYVKNPVSGGISWSLALASLQQEDVPRLKEILLSIPREKYLSLQMGVRKAQQHFLWHSKPVKYDAFHMILHSVWFNRVFNIRAR
ncbi:hypothetical protein COCNU_02G003780 [Cocos nucifera]|uniref:Casparian strip membrane protein domain-containing protein n=1 Tax=Cocos nucifera TaxID=13894 RepID=A0A8K0MW40_COCNU|nr:hypothetical protein COCNU_02G003780 [Cocos nucifera]